MKKLAKKISAQELLDEFVHEKRHNPMATVSLKAIVRRALEAGISRENIVDCGLKAGFAESSIRNNITSMMDEFGIRILVSSNGKGRDTRSVELASYARKKYGCDAARVLLGAYREIKRQESTARGIT